MIISDLGTVITGKTPTTKKEEYWKDGNIQFVTPGDLQGTKHIFDTERHVSELGMQAVKGAILPPNAVCVACIGNIGYVGMTTETCISNQQINSIIVNDDADPDYVYYLIKWLWPYFKNYEGQSTTLSILNKSQFSKIEVPDNSLENQRKISRILNSLDELIEENNSICRNLDEQAKLLFKEWVINNPDNESWEHGTFSDLIESTLGGDWGKDSPTGNYTEMVYCIRGADIPDVRAGKKGKMPTRYILQKNYIAKKLIAGDLVVEISGGSPTQSTGRIASISQSLLDRFDKGMVCTNFCRAIKPIDGYSMFIYYYWQYLYENRVFFSYENGTTGIKNLDLNGFLTTEEIVKPPEEIVKKFDVFCHKVFAQIFSSGLQNEKLAELRDYLIAKLIVGETE